MSRAIVLDDKDNVATLIDDAVAGEKVVFSGSRKGEIKLIENVVFGHKCATATLEAGDAVIKYGQVIGRATQMIDAGCHVHIHNVEALRGRGDLTDETAT